MRTKQKKQIVYLDMDGVIADFNNEKNALGRFQFEKGFFKKLHVMNEWGVNQLLNNDSVDVRILTKSPNKQADKDKRAWLKYYFPQIKRNKIIILRNNQSKASAIKPKQKGILLDDYGKNIEEWNAKGYEGYKVEKELQNYFHLFMGTNEWDA